MVAPPDNDVLWARALHVTHNGSPALTGVSLGVREGEILAVSGPRGSGKTTLLQCLSGQRLAQQGEVWFNSTPVHTMGALVRERLRRDRFGWIDPEPQLVPELTAWENVALPLMLRGASHRVSKPAALEWLERLDIGGCARKRPHALLQAERQRVAIARALVTTPDVLFADEPTATLHRADRAHALRTLTTAARSHGITVVLATHDAEVATLADRTVTLLDGRRVNTVHLPGAEGLAGAARGGDGEGGRTRGAVVASAPGSAPAPAPAPAAPAAPASVGVGAADAADAGGDGGTGAGTSVRTGADAGAGADAVRTASTGATSTAGTSTAGAGTASTADAVATTSGAEATASTTPGTTGTTATTGPPPATGASGPAAHASGPAAHAVQALGAAATAATATAPTTEGRAACSLSV